MKISEAMSIIEQSGLLLERIKKYRTTGAERVFRDTRSDYDRDAIRDKMWDIVREEDMERYVDGIGFSGDQGTTKQKIWVEFRGIGDFGKMLVYRLGKAVGSDEGFYKSQLYFNFEEVRKQSQKELTFLNLLEKMLYDRFGIPRKAFNSMSNYWELDQWLEVAKENYDVIEKFIEEEQYGGIHGLTYRKFRQTVKDAYAAAKSPENRDKFVTNQYGFQKQMEVIYAKFRKFCRLFKREFERQRGNLTKPAEAEA
jgi:hypothetical protein